jgi:hypothetical protein
MTKLNVNVLKEAGYYGHVISKRMPKDLDNRLYTMIHLIGGFTTRDVMFFLDQSTEEELKELHRLVKLFPSVMQELVPFAGSYKMLIQTEMYQEIMGIIKFNEEQTELTEQHKHRPRFPINVEKLIDKNPNVLNYITEKGIRALFSIWDNMGEANYDAMKLVGVVSDGRDSDDVGFRNVGDALYPILVLEWIGGVENHQFSKAPWKETSEMGFEKLKFKVEPISFDYLFDESADFGEHGYACWDIKVLIDKDGDLFHLPINPEFIDNYGDYTPFIQDLFPESSRNKLSSFRNYTDDQFDLIESLWDEYDQYRDNTMQFCRVEIVLVDESYFV